MKDRGNAAVQSDLLAIFTAANAEVVYLHQPADKHDTHVALLLSPEFLSRYQIINFSNFLISGLLALSLSGAVLDPSVQAPGGTAGLAVLPLVEMFRRASVPVQGW